MTVDEMIARVNLYDRTDRLVLADWLDDFTDRHREAETLRRPYTDRVVIDPEEGLVIQPSVSLVQEYQDSRPNVATFNDAYGAYLALLDLSWRPNLVLLSPSRDGSRPQERMTMDEFRAWVEPGFDA